MDFRKTKSHIHFSLVFLLLIQSIPVFSQTENRKLVLGIARFDTSELPRELENIGTLIPQQLLKRIYFFHKLTLSEDSLTFFDNKSKSLEQKNSRAKIAALQKDRDTIFFQSSPDSQKKATIRLKETEIKNESKKLSLLVGSNERKSTNSLFELILHADHAAGKLLELVENPRIESALNKVDYLIYGKCWETNGYIGYSINIYDSSLEKELYSSTQYGSLDDIETSLEDQIRPIAESILAKKYSLVSFRVEPADATVAVDGKNMIEKEIIYFENGEHTIAATAQGFQQKEQVFSVETGVDSKVSISLALKNSETISITSDPPGSLVFIDAEKIGITPVSIERSSRNKIARLELEGYNSSQIVIGPNTLNPIPVIQLKSSNGKSHEENFSLAKDRFYRSLGLFIGVLPVSLFSYGTFKMYETVLEKISSDFTLGKITEAQRNMANAELDPSYYASQIVFWPSLGASILIAGNAIFRLVLYIASTN